MATGNQLAAEAGATTGELMRRMGHSTVRAAMRYQHSTDRRDREIAAEMSRRADAAKGVYEETTRSGVQTFMALVGRPWMDETRGRRPLTLVTLIAAASAKFRLALELRGTLDCRYEHESQILSSPGSWGGPGWKDRS